MRARPAARAGSARPDASSARPSASRPAIAATGTIIGLLLGTAIGAALIKSFGPDQALTGFALPWTRLVIVLVAGVLVGLLAAVLPARRAAHLDPLDVLCDGMSACR